MAVSASALPPLPPYAVEIVHGAAFDAVCARLRGHAVPAAAEAELAAALPRLRMAWEGLGRAVLRAVAARSGRADFSHPRAVRVTLCGIPSSSRFGPIVNLTHHLPSQSADPVPLRYKVLVIDHELLHGFLARLDLAEQPMLRVHAGESARVRSHLHLFALMKAALLDLGEGEALAELRRIDGSLPDSSYRRAWQLVEATPDAYLRYVEEVRVAR